MLKINCKSYYQGTCTNFRVPRTLNGVGTRQCTDELNKVNLCAFREPHRKQKVSTLSPGGPKRSLISGGADIPYVKPKNEMATAIDVLQEVEDALETAMSVHHMGPERLMEKDMDVATKINTAGGYIAYLMWVKESARKMRQELIKLKGVV